MNFAKPPTCCRRQAHQGWEFLGLAFCNGIGDVFSSHRGGRIRVCGGGDGASWWLGHRALWPAIHGGPCCHPCLFPCWQNAPRQADFVSRFHLPDRQRGRRVFGAIGVHEAVARCCSVSAISASASAWRMWRSFDSPLSIWRRWRICAKAHCLGCCSARRRCGDPRSRDYARCTFRLAGRVLHGLLISAS